MTNPQEELIGELQSLSDRLFGQQYASVPFSLIERAIAEIREQQKQLAKVPDLYDEIERQQARIAELERLLPYKDHGTLTIDALVVDRDLFERQRDAALEALDMIATFTMPQNYRSFEEFALATAKRIRGMK